MGAKRGRRGRGAVYRRPDGLWVGQLSIVVDGKRQRPTIYAETLKALDQKMAEKRRQLQRGEHRKADGKTTGVFVREWLDDVHKPAIRESTYQLYKGIVVNHIEPFIGDVRLDRLTADQIDRLYAELLRNGRTNRMLRHVHVVLGAALRHAVKRDRLLRNPIAAVTAPRYRAPEMRYLTPEQGESFLRAAAHDDFFALFVLALDGGMRQGEIFALKRSDVDLKRRQVSVRRSVRYLSKAPTFTGTKTDRPRVVPISQRTANALRRHLKATMSSEFVFADAEGRPLRKDGKLIRKDFPALLKQAGVPEVRFHDLRHSAATRMLSSGIQPKIAADVLGHSVETLLQTYAHVIPALTRQAADLFDELGRK
jgi:integrase